MTHGAGGISCGGGGGFSSTSVTHYHGRRRRQDDGGSDNNVCCVLCYILFFLLCLVKMKPRSRIILTWLYCIVGACLTGGLIGGHYASRVLSASPTDMREVDQISSTFCHSVLIDSSSMISTYKFESEPKINESSSLKYNDKVSTSLKWNSYEYWGFYLLRGSVATAMICPDNGMYVYLIKGKDNLKAWIDDSYCSNCYEKEYVLSFCSHAAYGTAITFTASTSDQYYFLFANEGYSVIGPGPVKADITFMLDRKQYDLTESSLICSHDFDCNVPISMYSSETVVFYVPRESPRDNPTTIYCRPRVVIYLVLFALLPVMCGILVTYLIVRLTKKENQNRQRSDSERLHGIANESCHITVTPPGFTAPPSYNT